MEFLDEVYNRGCWNWDTAEGYADNEELIGKWFTKSGKRDDVRACKELSMNTPVSLTADPRYSWRPNLV